MVQRRWLALVVVLAACGGSSKAATPSASVTAPPTTAAVTTTTLTPQQEVEAAYLKSWDVYAKAVRTLDPSGLGESYAEDALTTEQNEIGRLKQNNTPGRIAVDHNYNIDLSGTDLAAVTDAYVNHSVFVDARTGDPTEADPNKRLTELYTLKKIEGTWKVTYIKRQQ